MFSLEYIYTLIILMGSGFLYRRFIDKYDNDDLREYKLIKKYLLSDSSIAKSNKPILWIHIPYEINSRSWESFSSRNTNNLNQPYLYLTIESIIKTCGNSFKVCLIDDNSFSNLIPGWTIELNKVGSPMKEKIRELAIAKLIYNYGGMIVPKSFLCFKDLINIYNDYSKDDKMFAFENICKNTTDLDFIPDNTFYGACKNSTILNRYCSFLEILISKDYTDQSTFLSETRKWLYNETFNTQRISAINGKMTGIKDKNNRPVLIDHLFEENFNDFHPSICGLHIDDVELLKRTKYNWFCYLHESKILTDCNNTLGKLFIKSKNNY